MIFADGKTEICWSELKVAVASRLERAVIRCSLESACAALIAAGQLEQAIADAVAEQHLHEAALIGAMALTDEAAAEFLGNGRACFNTIAKSWALIDTVTSPGYQFTVKVPEGFAFYGLDPARYSVAASLWAWGKPRGKVLVVGVRSIGTALSAVVKAMLVRSGWPAERITVRPTGHPFQRSVTLPPHVLADVSWVAVVDEGPGLSGSSMAAVAFAANASGVPLDHIAFLPAHSGKPGEAASDVTRMCWETVEQIVPPAADIATRLKAYTETLTQKQVVSMRDLSAGEWRSVVLPEGRWPAVCAVLERTKFQMQLADGSAVLWKFAGYPGVIAQNAERDLTEYQRATKESSRILVPEPLGVCDGFVATEWVTGIPLDATSPEYVSTAAAYLHSFRDDFPLHEAEAAHSRLRELIRVNFLAEFGEETAEAAVQLWDAAPPQPGLLCRDPQLAPYEWIKDQQGRIWKTDITGHLCDHTLLGRQPLEWGVAVVANHASAWDLPRLLNLLPTVQRSRLDAYRLAHIAYWLGVLDLTITTGGLGERDRVTCERQRISDLVQQIFSRAAVSRQKESSAVSAESIRSGVLISNA